MSSTPLSNNVAIFNNILWGFHHVVLPICFILGNIGNSLNLILFSQRSSRTNSCLLYFLSGSVVNSFILNVSLVLRILRGIWNIDPALKFVAFCRWRGYFMNACFSVYRYSILFACIDRACASSRSARMRKFSQPKVAYVSILIIWITVYIYFIPNLIFPVIMFGQCISPPDSIFATYQSIMALFQAALLSLLMIICGIITLRHLKIMNTQVIPLI